MLMESKAPACTRCLGEGTIVESGCPYPHCSGARTPMGCTHEVDFRGTCPRCEGSKVEPCDHCGEPATHLRDISGSGHAPHQPVCNECDPEEPRGDRPMGGMGYGIDYGEQLAEARRLK